MSIIRNVAFGETTDSLTTSQWLLDWYGGRKTASGTRVTATKSLALSAYFAAIRNISEDVGKLPLKTYKELDRGKETQKDHRVYTLLHDEPNDEMTAMSFRETLTSHAMGWGGGFAEIERSRIGDPIALHIIHPSRVSIKRRPGSKKLYYYVKSYDVDQTGIATPVDHVEIEPKNMFHIHGLGANGISGYCMSVLAKEAIGMGLEAERMGASFFANGMALSGILVHPGELEDKARRNLRRQWHKVYGGSKKSGKVAVLEEGVEYKQLSIPPEQAQYLETRQFQVEEIARWFRMPPHKLQHLLRSTFNNIESQNIEYTIDTLQPWLTRWEQEIKRKLFNKTTEKDLFAEHVVTALLRGDNVKRSLYEKNQFMVGAMSQNDIREAENRNSIGPKGDIYYVPMNMQPSEIVYQSLQKGEVPQAGQTGGTPPGEQGIGTTASDINYETLAKSYMPLFNDAANRILTKESKAIGRLAKKGLSQKDFELGVDTFFEKNIQYIISTLTIPAESLGITLEVDSVYDIVEDYAREHIEQMLSDIPLNYKNGEVDIYCKHLLTAFVPMATQLYEKILEAEDEI